MQIIFTVADADAPTIIHGIAIATGWTAGSGKTEAQWAKEKVSFHMKETSKRGLLIESKTDIASTVDPIQIT